MAADSLVGVMDGTGVFVGSGVSDGLVVSVGKGIGVDVSLTGTGVFAGISVAFGASPQALIQKTIIKETDNIAFMCFIFPPDASVFDLISIISD
jgi:hypothetical protein